MTNNNSISNNTQLKKIMEIYFKINSKGNKWYIMN